MELTKQLGEKVLSEGPSFKIGEFYFEPSYVQAFLIVFLIFLLLLTLARLRRLYVHWSLRTFLPSLIIGFILVLILEGFLIISGKTLLTEILGWKNPPKPVANLINIGKAKLVRVMGTSDESNIELNSEYLVDLYKTLSSKEAESFRSQVCSP